MGDEARNAFKTELQKTGEIAVPQTLVCTPDKVPESVESVACTLETPEKAPCTSKDWFRFSGAGHFVICSMCFPISVS